MNYDIRNHCFQDTAGTIPAIADGDPVALITSPFGLALLVSSGTSRPVMYGGHPRFQPCDQSNTPEPEDDTPDAPHIVTG